jgi:hypothetical protein
MTYFVCNLGDFAVESLLKFSLDKSVIIAIREYGVIENGELFLQNFGLDPAVEFKHFSFGDFFVVKNDEIEKSPEDKEIQDIPF